VLNYYQLGYFPSSDMAVLEALASYHAPASSVTISPNTTSISSCAACPASTALQPLIRSVAIQHGFHEDKIECWEHNVLSKLLAISISTIDELYYSSVPTLNNALESQGIISLHNLLMRLNICSLLEPLEFPASPSPVPLSTPLVHVIMHREGEEQKRLAAAAKKKKKKKK
jgi:hypothetical protein